MRLDHLLSKETSGRSMNLSVTSYWSVQSVKVFTLFNLEGTEKNVPEQEVKRIQYGPIAQLARAHD